MAPSPGLVEERRQTEGRGDGGGREGGREGKLQRRGGRQRVRGCPTIRNP